MLVLISTIPGFLSAHGLACETRIHHALRFGRKLRQLERRIDLDLLGLLVFCQFELWHTRIGELPNMVQKLLSDETLMDLAERNKGWFREVATRYESMVTPVVQQSPV